MNYFNYRVLNHDGMLHVIDVYYDEDHKPEAFGEYGITASSMEELVSLVDEDLIRNDITGSPVMTASDFDFEFTLGE